MTEEAYPEDAAARLAASDPARSVLLQAPAGSGKTAVLTERYLRLLCTVEDPGQILAITFTRKAAAEMRARVTRALRGEIAAEDATAARLRALASAALSHGARLGWNLSDEPQRLRIQTIDAFNFWLASELPVAARIGGALHVTDAAAALYARAARRTLSHADEDPTLAADATRLFERLDNHWMNLERLIGEMLKERGHWLTFVAGTDPEALCRRVDESLASLIGAHLAALVARLPGALKRRAQALPGVGELDAGPATLAGWQHLAHLTLTKGPGADWRARTGAQVDPAFARPEAAQALRDLIADLRGVPGAREALLELRRLPAARLAADDAAAIGSLARILSRAAAELQAEFAAAGVVDHAYVTGAARQALTEAGEPTDLALRTGFTLRHILVDEFQDTSLAQFRLLEMLTLTWAPGDGRTLFVVGDPMQSIYRFRDAEVGLFLRAREHGIGEVALTPLRLTRNFRTVPALVDFNNTLFGAVFPPEDDLRTGAVSYAPSIAARAAPAAAEGAPATLRLFGDRTGEAGAIAARIAQLRAQDPAASVAVLVAAHAHALPVIEALSACGIESLGVDLVPLSERTVVRDLVQLATAVCDLADRSAWLGVLRAPWCGATLATLSALSSLNDRQLVIEALRDPERLAGVPEPERRPLARVLAVLEVALARLGAVPACDWLEAAWVALGGQDCCPQAELADARAFLAALAEREAAGEWHGPHDFPTLLAHLNSAPATAAPNPVQVMTIHRAKGLEFAHVFVPALERGSHGGERRLLRFADLPNEAGGSDLLIAPAPAIGPHADAPLDAWLKDLGRRRDANERRRLMYVAATRARETLWLSGAPALNGEGEPQVRAHTLLATLWPALAQRFERAAPVLAAVGTPQAPQLMRLAPGWQPAALPPAVPFTHLPSAHLSEAAPEFSWVGETQRHIGTLVHEWLARLGSAPQLPGAATVGAARPAVLAQLARAGVPEHERAAAAELVLRAVSQTLEDERGRWLLDPAHREAHAELSLTGVIDAQLRNIIIDRSFIDADGTRWVIDFKTSRHEGGGLEAFLDEELQRYRAQLQSYVELARALGPQPVRAALYFPLLRAFREL
jgi:ATP-dependent helicase/nuclease subunit A